MNPIETQRKYYETTAGHYDDLHLVEEQHQLASELLMAYCVHYRFATILDVGAGTGRFQRAIKTRLPDVRVTGVEPVEALRKIGHTSGIQEFELIDGDVQSLPFAEGSFDVVSEFAMLHHVPNPDLAVEEMMRVASKAVFISDANLFGQGNVWVRLAKRLLDSMGLWRMAVLLKTKGKGYHISETDGLFYPYSAFCHFRKLRRFSKRLHITTFDTSSPDALFGASHVCILAIKKAKTLPL